MAGRKLEEGENKCSSMDGLSMLPDEVLVLILSLLTLKEAAATSILSRRWRYLWTSISGLDFDGKELLFTVGKEGRDWALALEEERSNYVRWVDHVIALHNNSTIESLRVYFSLTKAYESRIDEWLIYALARKVQRLELDLTDQVDYELRKADDVYTFPYRFLSCNSIHFEYLTKLSMTYVNVNGEALEFFLCNCPLLEDLSVSHSLQLLPVKIDKPFPSFKRLEIKHCHSIQSVEISDANLVYLRYDGPLKINFLLRNLPLLTEICIDGNWGEHIQHVLMLFLSILPQLERLKIFIQQKIPWKEAEVLFSALKLSNLKQLVVNVDLSRNDSLLPLTILLRASPSLQRFVLEAWRDEPKFVERNLKKVVSSYPHLKEVVFSGYQGATTDLELVMHFLENAFGLQKIVVNPRPTYGISPYDRFVVALAMKEEKRARTRAKKQLAKILVPPGVSLEIL